MSEARRSLDEYGPGEMAIPEWRVIQKVGGDYPKELGAKPGQFYNSVTDDICDELNLIVVDIPSGRARWGAEITGDPPECASLDARSNRSIYGDDCTKCEYRLDTPWTVDATERRKKCCLNFTVLGIDLDHAHMPCLIRAHGISALPVRQLITHLKVNKALKGEYHRAVVNIKTQAKDTKYGTAYALRPRITRLITDDEQAEELRIESQSLLGTPIPLPEARPEDEPVALTPEGQPLYTEREKERVATQAAAAPATDAPPAAPPASAKQTEPAKEEGKKEPNRKELDLDF
jgi:hypothetical protein